MHRIHIVQKEIWNSTRNMLIWIPSIKLLVVYLAPFLCQPICVSFFQDGRRDLERQHCTCDIKYGTGCLGHCWGCHHRKWQQACLSLSPADSTFTEMCSVCSIRHKYPTMYHFVTEMCTHVHISVTKWYIVGYGAGALWDLRMRSNDPILRKQSVLSVSRGQISHDFNMSSVWWYRRALIHLCYDNRPPVYNLIHF